MKASAVIFWQVFHWIGKKRPSGQPQREFGLPLCDLGLSMEKAAARFLVAVKTRQRIAIFADYDVDDWSRVHEVNLASSVALLARLHPLLARAPFGASVVAIASKNVPAPGPGAGAYSTSKAALSQLVRLAALEWAADGIRVNGVHPDAVFDTGLWADGRLEERAARYDLSPDEYRRRNLLGLEITSADVGALVAALCGSAFRATTGALIPIDGGNERVI